MVAKLDDFVPADHPLRKIQVRVNEALLRLNSLFNATYADSGGGSIAPEKLMRALLLQVFYSIRSERQLMEQLKYNLPFRWFVGLSLDDRIWNRSVFSKNRDRLFENHVVESFFAEVMRLADRQGLLSKQHFSVDGTLIQAWASRTDPDSRLYRKSHNTASILSCQGHLLMENRAGLVVGAVVTHADGTGEREAALRMPDCVPGSHPKTVGRIRQTVFRGIRRVDQPFKRTMTASTLTRMARMMFAVPQELRQRAANGHAMRLGIASQRRTTGNSSIDLHSTASSMACAMSFSGEFQQPVRAC